ncbi:hypothetical protein J6590_102605, partial [Homalodisca vitripennis]
VKSVINSFVAHNSHTVNDTICENPVSVTHQSDHVTKVTQICAAWVDPTCDGQFRVEAIKLGHIVTFDSQTPSKAERSDVFLKCAHFTALY